jgi:hypothetical protein
LSDSEEEEEPEEDWDGDWDGVWRGHWRGQHWNDGYDDSTGEEDEEEEEGEYGSLIETPIRFRDDGSIEEIPEPENLPSIGVSRERREEREATQGQVRGRTAVETRNHCLNAVMEFANGMWQANMIDYRFLTGMTYFDWVVDVLHKDFYDLRTHFHVIHRFCCEEEQRLDTEDRMFGDSY